MAKTIIVSNRLPVKISREGEKLAYKPSEGGLATGLGSIYKEGDNVWVGWPGLAIEDASEQKDVKHNLAKENMHPVFLTAQEIEDFYEGFSNETLWPNFHYFNQYAVYNQNLWEAYCEVNAKFASELENIIGEEDTLWIHDYQLLLVPQMIRKKFPKLTIGFFLHIPFPSYESFRLLPWRRQLLEGMLGADLLGFHTYDDMRHFLSSVNRLAGLGNSNGLINLPDRKVMADALPMGIDYDKYAISAASPDTLSREVRYRTSIGKQKLMLSIDRLDYSKGIPQRLRAFELFLERNESYRGNVSCLMVVVPSRDQVPKYKQLKEEIDLLVGRINGKYSRLDWTPVHYFYRSFPLSALSAFYRMADVAIVTPMRDGMNLVCKEFIASKLDKKGVLILSEMAGASKELSDAILINPNDIDQQVNAISRALSMPEEEQIKHMEIMQESLKRYNIHHWVNLFMERLLYIKTEQRALETRIIDAELSEQIISQYNQASERLIFLDYDGTLVGFHSDPLDSLPDKELKEILAGLIADKKNNVVVISGRGKETLAEWLEEFDIDIIAEHGVWYLEKGSDWEISTEVSHLWKEDIRKMLDQYVDRTPGSFIENKDYSLVWHYRKVETGLGEVRTRELTSHLKYVTSNKNLQVMEGDKVVEIKNSNVNKGAAAKKWISKYKNADFVMAFGDDSTDEDTFMALPENSVSVKVGNSASAAKYNVSSYIDVRKLLKKLIK